MAPSTQRLTRVCFWMLLGIPVVMMACDANFCLHRSTGLHADPQDCQALYLCHDSKTMHYRCQPGRLFNPKLNYCDWPEEVQCPKGRNPNTEASQVPESKTNTDNIQAQMPGEFCRNKATDNYADPTSCKHFIKCTNGATNRIQCRNGTLYNAQTKHCDLEANIVCSSKSNATSTSTTKPPATSSENSSSPATSGTTKGQSTTPAPNPLTLNRSDCPRIVCYFTKASRYRKGLGKFEAKDVDPYLCTHIMLYGFTYLNGNQLKIMEGNDETSYQIMTNHKKANPQLKVLLSVVGWSVGSNPFTAMVATRESRQEFIDTTIRFLRDRDFDGLDLYWQFPTEGGSPPDDKQRFLLLCQELRDAFEAEGRNTGTSRLLLTAAVAAIKRIIENAYDIRPLSAALDFISIVSFSYRYGRSSVTGHPSPLYPHPSDSDYFKYFNVNSSVGFWLNGGAVRDKLVVGISLNAHSIKLANSSNNDVAAPASGRGSPGPYTNNVGRISYYEVCMARNSGGIRHFIEEQRVPYLVAGDQWVGYEDQASLREKVRYVRDMNLGGAMVFDLSQDDFNGSFCNEGKYPLIHAIVDECKIRRFHIATLVSEINSVCLFMRKITFCFVYRKTSITLSVHTLFPPKKNHMG